MCFGLGVKKWLIEEMGDVLMSVFDVLIILMFGMWVFAGCCFVVVFVVVVGVFRRASRVEDKEKFLFFFVVC